MTFVTRSTPFCRPKLHTKKPITTATIIQSDQPRGILQHTAERRARERRIQRR